MPDLRPYATDDDLLVSDDPEAFGVFYDRHVRTMLGYFARRTSDPEVAADLTAETFASAITARRRYKPGKAPAGAWLYAIAARRLSDFHRRGHVEARAQRTLAMQRVPVGVEDAELIGLLADDVAVSLLTELPSEQQVAVQARVIDGDAYQDIAEREHVGEAAVRQRVSRGLATLRGRIGGPR
jgi:RNA polymerase sigma-70 factor (ECF subfamily)